MSKTLARNKEKQSFFVKLKLEVKDYKAILKNKLDSTLFYNYPNETWRYDQTFKIYQFPSGWKTIMRKKTF